MKTLAAISIIFLAVIFSTQLFAVPGLQGNVAVEESKLPPRWERLGMRKVNFRLDRDEIVVTGREGVFSALKFKVKRGGINMHRMVVHFRDGSRQEINVRQNIPAGGETRIIDLKGNKRIITKVVFWYDTKNLARRRGTIELWGRH